MKTLALWAIGALVVAGVAGAAIAMLRRRRSEKDLSKHPERLEQMLDPTDDA
jgi:hypothetical protein